MLFCAVLIAYRQVEIGHLWLFSVMAIGWRKVPREMITITINEREVMIKKVILASVCLGLVTGISSAFAAEKPDPGAVLSSSTASAHDKVAAIQSYVSYVEKNLPSLTRKEAMLKPESLKTVTDENWRKIHGYFDGDTLRRMKLYPNEGSQKTEEFYFYQNQLVFVFVEEKGSNKDGHDKNAVGSKFYFSDGKFLAAMGPDGKMMEPTDAQVEKMNHKLPEEAAAFRARLQ